MEEQVVEKNENVESKFVEGTLSTIGEERIGIRFKKGNNGDAQNLKEHFAHIINTVNKLNNDKNGRLIAETMTLIETASMFATKALFTK